MPDGIGVVALAAALAVVACVHLQLRSGVGRRESHRERPSTHPFVTQNKSTNDDALRAYATLSAGGVVLLPTDVGFGLVACTDAAILRIYGLKGRPRTKPCVTVANAAILDDVAPIADVQTRAWVLQTCADLPLAVVGDARPASSLLRRLSPVAVEQATTHRSIATFLNAGALVTLIAELAFADGRMVLGSSANAAFTGNNYALEEVPASMRDAVDLVIEGPPAPYANPGRLATTILDLRSGQFIREGIEHARIAASWSAFRAA